MGMGIYSGVGSISLLGLTLPNVLALQSVQAAPGKGAGSSFGRAKSVIFVFLQGGPSHIDLWDPKPDQPEIRRLLQEIRDIGQGATR